MESRFLKIKNAYYNLDNVDIITHDKHNIIIKIDQKSYFEKFDENVWYCLTLFMGNLKEADLTWGWMFSFEQVREYWAEVEKQHNAPYIEQ